MSARPRVLVAFASLKGTASSRQAGEAVARGLRAAGCDVVVFALADGGEGLVEALAGQVPGAERVSASCRGPFGEPREATFALLPGAARVKRAVIEMAASSGLPLVPEDRRDAKRTTTLGVGDQIRAALDRGAGAILLGLGGSATNDGGAGMAQALGARLLDAAGSDLPAGGAALARLARIDVSRIDTRLRSATVTAACDVRNPLCGAEGASRIFGPQKGANAAEVDALDAALAHFARIIARDLGRQIADVPGAGAAGGLGAGCLAFLGARLVPGADLVLDAIGFDAALAGAALVVTGEGLLDDQTLMGKAPAAVVVRAARAGVACIAVGGGIAAGYAPALGRAFAQLESLSAFAGSVAAAKAEPERWLEALARARAAAWLESARVG